MIIKKLSEMIKGWFIGDFVPSVHSAKEFEVAVKRYLKGDEELAHFHKIATEITVIISGSAKFNDKVVQQDQIIVVNPGEIIRFSALEDCSTVVVKIPSVVNDKYIVD